MTDYEHLVEINAGLRAENGHLRHWKAEALVVLSEWDDVWKAAGCPGPLGGKKAKAVNDHVEAILTDADLQRESFMAADARARRAEAQVERDRPVIEAARAWAYEGGWGGALLNALDAYAASAPDEVNEAQQPNAPCPTPCDDDCDAPCHEGHYPQYRRHHDLNDHAPAPDEVNEAETCVCGHPPSEHFRDTHTCMHSTADETWACNCDTFRAPDEVNEVQT